MIYIWVHVCVYICVHIPRRIQSDVNSDVNLFNRIHIQVTSECTSESIIPRMLPDVQSQWVYHFTDITESERNCKLVWPRPSDVASDSSRGGYNCAWAKKIGGPPFSVWEIWGTCTPRVSHGTFRVQNFSPTIPWRCIFMIFFGLLLEIWGFMSKSCHFGLFWPFHRARTKYACFWHKTSHFD